VNTHDHMRLLIRHVRELAVRRGRLRRSRLEVADDLTRLACIDAAISRLTDEIDHRRDHLAIVASTGSYQPWSHHHFRLGDLTRIGGAWYSVLHAGWTALTVPPLDLLGEPRHNPVSGQVDTDSVAYFRVYGRRRAGRMLHTPPPPDDAACTCRVTIPTFNPEFVPERDAGPCTEPPVARLTFRHDGTACGCHGMCLLPDADSANPSARRPWVEVVLLCDNHADEHTPASAAPESSAITFEELT
jgi:hypothetical protein